MLTIEFVTTVWPRKHVARLPVRIVRRHTPSSWAHAGWLKARLRRSSRNPSDDRCQTRRRRPGFGVRFGAQCLRGLIMSAMPDVLHFWIITGIADDGQTVPLWRNWPRKCSAFFSL